MSMPAQKQGKVTNFYSVGTDAGIVIGMSHKASHSLPDE